MLDAFFNVLATLRQCISRWDLEYSWYLSKNAFTFLFSWSKGFNSKWPIVPALARPSGGRHWSWSGPDPWHGRSLPRQPSGRSGQVFKTLHTFLWSEGVLEESRTELKSWHRLNTPPLLTPSIWSFLCKHDRFLEATHILVFPPNISGKPYHCHSFLKSILGQFWTIGRVFHIPYNLLFHRQQEHLRVTVSTWREEHFRCLRDQEFERSRSRVALPAFQIKIISPILSCVSTICMNLVPQGYTRTQISLGAWDLPLHWYPEARAGRYGGGFGFLRSCFWSIFKELVV